MPRLLNRGGGRPEGSGRPAEGGASSSVKDRARSPDSWKKQKGAASLSSRCGRALLFPLLFLFLLLLFLFFYQYPPMPGLRVPLFSRLLPRQPSSVLQREVHHGGRRPMDTFFVSHGMPTLALDKSLPARSFLQSWQKEVLPEQPKAIVMVSAHWDTEVPTVNIVDGVNPTIYDFYGFPRPLYKLKYPAPGAPELAKRVKELLERAGNGPVLEAVGRGLDHGAWVPLVLMYPEANIPVCQLSIQSDQSAEHHYRMGQALAPLREEGVLIIASGSATHNQRDRSPPHLPPPKWAADFMSWLRQSLLNGRHEDVNYYIERGAYPKMAHPTTEHFVPLHVAMGAAGEKAKTEVIHDSWSHGTLCYDAYRFSSA